MVGREVLEVALSEGQLSPALLRDRFRQAREERRSPLSALELHRIFAGLAAVATADGRVDASEQAALRELAGVCGVNESFVDVVLAKAA